MSENGSSSVETILKWIVLIILAVVALKIVFGVFAIAWVIGGALLTKVLPIVVLIWLIIKGVEWLKDRNGSDSADTEI
jgi:membrane protein YdbS with pleckstrin-like domain